MRSTVPYTFDRRHGLVFELTCVCLSAETHFTHTLSMNAIESKYVRSIACVLSPHVTFLGHFPPFPLHFFSLNSHFPISALTPPKHEPNLTIHHPTTPSPPLNLCTTVYHHHRLSHQPYHPHFSIFSSFSHKSNLPQIPQFVPIFECPKAQSIHGLCPFCFSLGIFRSEEHTSELQSLV